MALPATLRNAFWIKPNRATRRLNVPKAYIGPRENKLGAQLPARVFILRMHDVQPPALDRAQWGRDAP